MPLREGEVWGEVTEAGLERLLERKGVARKDRGTMFRVNRSKEGLASTGKPSGDEWKPVRANYAVDVAGNMAVARGIADMNPLYTDPEYAAGSPWGRLIAPPATLCWTELVNGATDGFPGCHTIWRGVEYEWARPLYVGEKIASRTYLTDAHLLDSNFGGGKAAVQNYETEAVTMDGEFVGAYRTSWHRFSRKRAKKSSKYQGVERHVWEEDELEAVWEEYRTQNRANRRGAEPLYWEDVAPGDAVPHIIKGPVTLTSKLAFEFARGAMGWVVGHELALELWEVAPRLPIRNEENVPEPPVAIHWTNERCQTYLGMPGAYEAGFERLNWFTQLLMSWMGDHGLMRAMSAQFRAFHWQGDAVRLFATVTDKRVEDGEHLVDLRIWSESHPRGERTTEGEATVQLPSRG